VESKQAFYIQEPFRKLCLFLDNVEKYSRAKQASDDNMAHARCMLDAQGLQTQSPNM
jgi:hypothetical protein